MKSLSFCRQGNQGNQGKEASDLVDQEIQDMLRKGAIVVSDPKEDQFLSSLFLVKKKDGGIAH